MKLLKLWTMTIDQDRIVAIITDIRHQDESFQCMPKGGCLVMLEGCLLPLPLGPDDTKLLSDLLGGFHPR